MVGATDIAIGLAHVSGCFIGSSVMPVSISTNPNTIAPNAAAKYMKLSLESGNFHFDTLETFDVVLCLLVVLFAFVAIILLFC